MSLNDLENLNALDDSSEDDEEMYIPVPFRFHDLAQRDEYQLLDEEIAKNNKRDYNPKEVQLSLDQEDNYGFTPLHIAIMRGNLNTIRVCLKNGVKLSLKTEGIPYAIFAILMASSTELYQDNLFEVIKELVIPDKLETMKDRLDRTIAHLAASFNMVDVLDNILTEYPTLLETVDKEGNSILHYACKSNSVDCVSFLMDTYPQLAAIRNKFNQSALHTCLYNSAIESYQTLIKCHSSDLDIKEEDIFGHVPITQWKKIMEEKREKNSSGFPHEEAKTLILVPEPYDNHQTCSNPPLRTEKFLPPEQIQRLNVLVSNQYGGSLLETPIQPYVDFKQETQLISMPNLLRVHDMNYIMKIVNASSHPTATGRKNVDIDTVVSAKSFSQARCAAQAICTAVDELSKTATSGEGYRNAFCCVRPPGHHIGTNGAVNNPNNSNVSQGFCLFNNVAIGAAYARATYDCFKRVAIVDIDIHHGNGTEDCIQHCCPCQKETKTMLDNMEFTFKNYQYKPWLNEEDGDNILFASIHGYGKLGNTADYFYPGSGHEENKVDYIKSSQSGISYKIPSIIDAYINKQQGSAAYYWRESLRANILPKLLEFKPDLIFISAGFDAHGNDVLNNGYGSLNEFDFAYATSELIKIANTVCNGQVISVLEGGYDILGGCGSPLALSVQAHVEELCRCYYNECDPEEWTIRSEMERKEIEAIAASKGETVTSVVMTKPEIKEKEEKTNQIDDMEEEEEEGSFDFNEISDEEEPMEQAIKTTPAEVKPVEPIPVVEDNIMDDDDDGSEDLVNYEMPEIEAGELDKIEDPYANEAPVENGGRRKRTRAKVDYVALEAQLRKEEEEMRKKMMKKQ